MGKNPQIIRLSKADERKFWSQVLIPEDMGDCWLWQGGTFGDLLGWTTKNYGCTAQGDVAHRVAYYLYFNEQPGKKLVCHRCDTPLCCNPHHLFLGTHKDNTQDMMSKGRHRTRSSGRRITPEEQELIKNSSYTNCQLARKLGVRVQTISRHRNS